MQKKLSMFDKKFLIKVTRSRRAFHDEDILLGIPLHLKTIKNFIENRIIIIDELETVDIDTHEDWKKSSKYFIKLINDYNSFT